MCGPYVDALFKWTMIFEWVYDKLFCGSEWTTKDMCIDEIELCAHSLDIILNIIVNIVREGLFNYSKGKRNIHS